MIRGVPAIVFLYVCVGFVLFLPPAMAVSSVAVQTGNGGGFKVREPNLYAPNLYADNLGFIATLEKLPGATKKRSSWELSYQLFLFLKISTTRRFDVYQGAVLTRQPNTLKAEYCSPKVIKRKRV